MSDVGAREDSDVTRFRRISCHHCQTFNNTDAVKHEYDAIRSFNNTDAVKHEYETIRSQLVYTWLRIEYVPSGRIRFQSSIDMSKGKIYR